MRKGLGLYRGLTLLTKEWVYGNVDYNKDRTHCRIRPIGDEPTTGFQVDPETVGEFSGKVDANGVDMYEHDHFASHPDHKGMGYSGPCVVMWSEEKLAWYGWFPAAGTTHALAICDDVVVVGNLHTNPELLQGWTTGLRTQTGG